MHTLVLTGALLMAAAATCFAQNTIDVVQIGTGQKAIQTQVGNNQHYRIEQIEGALPNFGNATVINQTGSKENNAYFSQKNGSASNYAEINQTEGTTSGALGNNAFISQSNNSGAGTSTVPVSGDRPAPGSRDGNYAFIQQAGNNSAVISQDGGVLGGSNGNVTSVHQFGTNTGSVEQSNNSVANEATLVQGTELGNASGILYITQSGGPLGRSADNRVSIDQQGFHHATVSQTNLSVGNQVVITQEGNDNYATIDQSKDAQFNKATIRQHIGTGNPSNLATIIETANSQRNVATIDQYDKTGSASIYQVNHAADNTASITQGTAGVASIGDFATISQSNAYATGGLTGNRASINQQAQGSYFITVNAADIKQGRNTALTGSARVDALGVSSQNTASVVQEGSFNSVRLYQVGNRQGAVIIQTGSNNLLAGTALAENSDHATQYGVGNSLSINQLGGQTAGVFQYGTGNVGTINQSAN